MAVHLNSAFAAAQKFVDQYPYFVPLTKCALGVSDVYPGPIPEKEEIQQKGKATYSKMQNFVLFPIVLFPVYVPWTYTVYKMARGSPGGATFEFKNQREFISCAAGVLFMGIRVLSRLWMRREFTYFISIRKDHKLCRTGPYSIVRNPGYVGFIGNLLCDAIYWNHYGLYAYALLMAIAITFKIDDEEKVLRKEFNEEYDDYTKSTPYKLIPFLY